jgi:enoyl-CoA hydratase/carnithine racemase
MTSRGPIAPSTPLMVVDDAGVATISLNRPAHRNRLEDEDLRTLLRHFDRIDAQPQVRVLKLTANTQGQPKPVFCAGYHIGSFSAQDGDPRLFERVADALAALRPITVCALNGSVYGGATDLVLACDLGVGLAGIEFRMPATAIGLHRGVTRDEARRLIADTLPAKRLGDPAEFGAACAFLCGRRAGFMTGQNLQLDGGAYSALI